jgi:hypothetical protein
MRRAALGALAVLALVLTGCAEIPTSGTVQAGSTEGPNDTSIIYLPNPPAAGANPREIVTGFLSAASAGGDLKVAKQYLSTEFAKRWKPRERVLVQEAQPTVVTVSDTALRFEVPTSASVNEHGVYTAETRTVPLDFDLVQQRGQWRIASAPDGIVLGPSVFQRQYRPQALEFFDPTWTRLVPDVRWFPVQASGGSGGPRLDDVVRTLINGPAGPLANGITANALGGAELQGIEEGPAGTYTVALRVAGAEPNAATLTRMQQQLIQSALLPTPTAVRLVVNGRTAPRAEQLVNQPGTLDAYVLLSGRFGTLGANGDFSEEPTLGRRIAATRPSAVTISVRQKFAAVLDGSQRVVVVGVSGAPRVADERGDLLPPTVDQRGWVYSIPKTDPSGLQAWNGKKTVSLVGGIPGDSVTAIEASPDGTRMLVLVQNDSTGPQAIVAGIERAADGTPIGLTTAHYQVAVGGGGKGIDATWQDDGAVAVLSSAPDNTTDRVRVQQLGGVDLALGQLTNARTIVGTSEQGDLRVRLESGALWVWNNNLWQAESKVQTDVSVLAVQR